MKRIYYLTGAYIIFVLLLFLEKGFSQESNLAQEYEISIIEQLTIDSTKKEHPYIYVYSTDKIKKKTFENKLKKFAKRLKLTSSIHNADFILVLDLNKKLNLKKPALALSFNVLKFCLNCIGVFSWRNGRPNLILFKDRLRKFTIILPKEYSYFIE